MSDRWQDDEDRAARVRAWLSDVERARLNREAALAAAAVEGLDTWMQRRADERVTSSAKGLDAAIWMALSADVEVPPEEIAQEASVTLEHVEAVRERVGGRRR